MTPQQPYDISSEVPPDVAPWDWGIDDFSEQQIAWMLDIDEISAYFNSQGVFLPQGNNSMPHPGSLQHPMNNPTFDFQYHSTDLANFPACEQTTSTSSGSPTYPQTPSLWLSPMASQDSPPSYETLQTPPNMPLQSYPPHNSNASSNGLSVQGAQFSNASTQEASTISAAGWQMGIPILGGLQGSSSTPQASFQEQTAQADVPSHSPKVRKYVEPNLTSDIYAPSADRA